MQLVRPSASPRIDCRSDSGANALRPTRIGKQMCVLRVLDTVAVVHRNLLLLMILVWGLSSPIWTYSFGGTGGSGLEAVTCAAAVTSDYEGPLFIEPGGPGPGVFVDYIITEPISVNVTLQLQARVWDPDGVDTVIGSYKNSSETHWNNVTMTHTHDDPDNVSIHCFHANATWWLIDPTHRTMIWDVMFYAHNTQDRWAASYVVQYSYCGLYSSTTHSNDGQDGLVLLMVGGAAAIVMTSAIVAIYLKRRGG